MGTINRNTYIQLINNDAKWLVDNTDNTLEREHILGVLWQSIDLLYPPSGREETDTNLGRPLFTEYYEYPEGKHLAGRGGD